MNPASIGSETRTDESWEAELYNFHARGAEKSWLMSKPIFYDITAFSHVHSYPIDIMHNFILGIYPDFLARILPSHVNEELLMEVKRTKREMDFKGCVVKFKKSKGKSRNKYKAVGNAKEQYTFFLNLPEVLDQVFLNHFGGSSFDYDDQWERLLESEEWKAYLCLRAIDCYLVQEKYEAHQLIDLKHLVNDFFVHRDSCELGQNISPKLHYLTHLVDEICIHGPLMAYSTTMYERKHKVFKDKSKTSKSSISKSFSLVHWNQKVVSIGKPIERRPVIQVTGMRKKLDREDFLQIGHNTDDLLYKVSSIRADN